MNNAFKEKYRSLPELMEKIVSGNTLVTAMAASEPYGFYSEIHNHIRDKTDIKVYCANPTKPYEVFVDDSCSGHIELRPMFLTSSVKIHQQKGHVHYIPQHLSQWVANLKREADIDIFWGSCSLPDERGFASLGPSVCYESECIKAAKMVILEVNPQLPVTYGSSYVPIKQVDYLYLNEHPVPEVSMKASNSEAFKIAEHIADLVPDGATLQLGIGSIPNALSEVLLNKKDLGIHTEMINDTIIKLAKAGVITGRRKSIWPDKIVGSFALGTKELYDFMNGNPVVELYPASVVNDPIRIGRNYKMMSINTAVEIDITGQVCSESIGHLELSGVGGATDTHVGAQKSADGRGIIALDSLTKHGKSKIVLELHPGAKVSISRNDIDTVVTEYGIANLRGKTVADRTKNLINVAHPSVRDELRFAAQKVGYL